MRRNWASFLLVATVIALAGSFIVQLYWVRNTIALTDAQQQQALAKALAAVSDRLERMETLEQLRVNPAGHAVLERIDSLDRLRSTMPTLGMRPMENGPEDRGRRTFIREAPQEGTWHTEGDTFLAILPPPELDAHDEDLVTAMVKAIIATSLLRDITQRVDPAALHELLGEELQARGVHAVYEHGIYDAQGDPVLVHLEDPDDAELLRRSPHRVRLFRSDLAGTPYYLHVHLPESRRMLMRSFTPMLLLSGFFILVILATFLHSHRIILRQKRINAIKNDLVNNLTHELKTPISTIGLACEALTDPGMPRTPRQVDSFVSMIRDENKRLGVLVENVLQSAVMDSGSMLLKKVELDLHALLGDVVRTTGIQAERLNGRIELALEAGIYHVQGDRIHLTNVFHNLLDNALKYTELPPHVRICTSNSPTELVVRISDNGIGIARNEQARIFDKLYRVSTGNVHNVKGFGLGLSYVRNVVERHGGRIRVESEPGKGSTFIINLPFDHG
jgi:two-component system phosphate regulon sensor histidine kinase PhoR